MVEDYWTWKPRLRGDYYGITRGYSKFRAQTMYCRLQITPPHAQF